MIPEFPVRLLGHGPDAFSVEKLLETSCPVIGPSHGGSSSSVGGATIDVFSHNRKHK